MPRAVPMKPEERRAAIIAAAEPLLVAHGRDVSTKQLAEAAGVAEGTLFRVFDTKDEVIRATLDSLIDVTPTVAAIGRIDPDLGLAERLIAVVRVLQARLDRMTALFSSIGHSSSVGHSSSNGVRPAKPDAEFVDKRRREHELLITAVVAVIGSDSIRLRVDPAEAARLLTALTFSNRHPILAPHRDHTAPEQVVDLLLHGIERVEASQHEHAPRLEHVLVTAGREA